MNHGDDTDRDGEQCRAEVRQQERRIGVRVDVDAAHGCYGVDRAGSIQPTHHEGGEDVHHSGRGGAGDRGDCGQDDDGAHVHEHESTDRRRDDPSLTVPTAYAFV